jgi:hypothetical protein
MQSKVCRHRFIRDDPHEKAEEKYWRLRKRVFGERLKAVIVAVDFEKNGVSILPT